MNQKIIRLLHSIQLITGSVVNSTIPRSVLGIEVSEQQKLIAWRRQQLHVTFEMLWVLRAVCDQNICWCLIDCYLNANVFNEIRCERVNDFVSETVTYGDSNTTVRLIASGRFGRCCSLSVEMCVAIWGMFQREERCPIGIGALTKVPMLLLRVLSERTFSAFFFCAVFSFFLPRACSIVAIYFARNGQFASFALWSCLSFALALAQLKHLYAGVSAILLITVHSFLWDDCRYITYTQQSVYNN